MGSRTALFGGRSVRINLVLELQKGKSRGDGLGASVVPLELFVGLWPIEVEANCY